MDAAANSPNDTAAERLATSVETMEELLAAPASRKLGLQEGWK